MTRVVTLGEIMLRLSPPGAERFFQSPVLTTYFGGSEANVAVSLAHFGVDSAYVTRLPDNAVGDAALRMLRAEGVDVDLVQRGGRRLGLYFVEPGADLRPMRVVYDRAGSAFSEADPAAFDWNALLEGADWLHVSGITPALGAGPEAIAHAAVSAARERGVPVSIDLNYRAALWDGRDPVAVIRPLAAGCDLVVGNRDAIAAMLGIEVAGSGDAVAGARAVAERVHAQLGCARVAVTQRDARSASEHGWSAALFDGAAAVLHQSQRYQVQVVDRVGGGDSFVAGLVYALLDGRDAVSALRFATAASALKLTVPGDVNRVSVAEVERLLGVTEGQERVNR